MAGRLDMREPGRVVGTDDWRGAIEPDGGGHVLEPRRRARKPSGTLASSSSMSVCSPRLIQTNERERRLTTNP